MSSFFWVTASVVITSTSRYSDFNISLTHWYKMVPTTSHPSTAILYFYLLKSNLIDYLFILLFNFIGEILCHCGNSLSSCYCMLYIISWKAWDSALYMLGSFLAVNPGTYNWIQQAWDQVNSAEKSTGSVDEILNYLAILTLFISFSTLSRSPIQVSRYSKM